MGAFEKLGVIGALAIVVAGCGASDATSEETADDADEALVAGDARAVDIGFNGGPDQFEFTDDFFASEARRGPRLCHTYVRFDVAEQRPDPGSADSEPGSRGYLERWLRAAQGHCDEAFISFKAAAPGRAPSEASFTSAFRAFVTTSWAQETGFTGGFAFSVWNEPNNPAGSGNGLGTVIEPELAARYYLAAEKLCRQHGCKVAAGDFASNGGTWNDYEWNCANDNVAPRDLCKQASARNPGHRPASYLDRYKNTIANHADEYGLGARFRPEYFAFHGWHDANEYLDTGSHCSSYSDCVTRRLLTSLGGSWGQVQLWDTEVGVDQDAAPISDHEQACGAAFLLRVTALSKRITRLYYTRYHGGTGELARNHAPRPAMQVLADRETHVNGCR